MPQISLVTGANRGIGLEVVRQLAARGQTVYLATRDLGAGERAAQPLIAAGLDVHPVALDVTDAHAARAVAAQLAAEHGRLDALVNNAAIHYDTWQHASTANLQVVREALEVNLLGAGRPACLLPLLRASGHGRIVNVSSEAGSLAGMDGGPPAYNVSKRCPAASVRARPHDIPDLVDHTRGSPLQGGEHHSVAVAWRFAPTQGIELVRAYRPASSNP
jgi:NAD(P)-dependent dehydrogenase (short-subunit alcohol dehydrogenase family)